MATILISLLTTHTPLCCVHIFSVGTRVATEGDGSGIRQRVCAFPDSFLIPLANGAGAEVGGWCVG